MQTGHRLSQSYRGATHIVKLWEPNEYPQLAANEYFCLTAAGKCGLDVPVLRLADDGMALVVDRFDLRMDGSYRGFEDFCALNARRTDGKCQGSYETHVMRRFTQFANSAHVNEDLEKLFTLIALNCAIRNGDAHLKNLGVVYDDVEGEARLAPVFDLVTTTVYLPRDSQVLTLNGSKNGQRQRSSEGLVRPEVVVRPRRSGNYSNASRKRLRRQGARSGLM